MVMDQCQQHCLEQPAYGFWQRFGRMVQSLGQQIERSARVARQRRQLLEMDDRLLKDIGLSRVDAERLAGWHGSKDDPSLKRRPIDPRVRY